MNLLCPTPNGIFQVPVRKDTNPGNPENEDLGDIQFLETDPEDPLSSFRSSTRGDQTKVGRTLFEEPFTVEGWDEAFVAVKVSKSILVND